MKKRLLTIALMLVSTSLSAQISWYDVAVGQNFCINSTNPSTLSQLSGKSFSKVEARFGRQTGELRDYSSSPDSYDFGFGAEALRRIERTHYFGGIEYDYFDGKKMCGSMFTSPGEFPIDIIEYTPGRKTKETYHVYGKFGTRVADKLSVGAGLDYTSSNYAKRKDLRHKNTKMNLRAEAGLTCFFDDVSWIGFSAFYGRKTEKITAEEIGTLDLNYDAFFNCGNWYGARELWTGSSIHLQETGLTYFPVAENSFGAAIQSRFKIQSIDVHNELSASVSEGTTGERGIVWHNFTRRTIADRLELSSTFAGLDNTFYARAEYSSLANNESILGRITENGVTQTVVYGYNLIYSERRLTADAGYRFHTRNLSWSGDAGITFNQFSGISSLMYPTYKNRYYTVLTPYCNLRKGLGALQIELGYGYRFGTGRNDRSLTSKSDMTVGDYPDYESDMAAYEWEWLTMPCHRISVGASYSFKKWYLLANYSFNVAEREPKYLSGRVRHTLGLSVGLRF